MKENIIYSCDYTELSKSAKEFALENHRYDFCEKNLIDFCEEITEKIKSVFEDVKFFYTGFYSQGDGACFEFKGVNFERLFEELEKRGNIFSSKCKELLKENFTCEGYHRGHYYHEHSIVIEWYCVDCEEFDKEVQKFADCLENLRIEFCDELYAELEKTYEEFISDDYVAYCLAVNEYKFLESGQDFIY